MNNRDGDDIVKERLDRVLCNLDWRLTFLDAEVFALPAVGSDHSPLLLNTKAKPGRRHRPFLFEAFWLQDLECREVIANAWNLATIFVFDLIWRLLPLFSSRFGRHETSPFSIINALIQPL